MYILPFNSTETSLETAGGKGANLARLTRAGFNVPPGFILSTAAYQDFVNENRLQPLITEAVQGLSADDPAALESASARIRAAFGAGSCQEAIRTELLDQYAGLGGVPAAVRSSATTEDLPEFSFAGQQDTFLNIQGGEALQKAVVDCWSSLWTARAIGYRLRNYIPGEGVGLAVVVQAMVESEVSGVLFTANPLSGALDESVIDATFGLGEALVSGQVEPDHFVIEAASGQVKSVRLGEKALTIRSRSGGGVEKSAVDGAALRTLSDEALRELARAGQSIQQEYGAPQDIEWALAGGKLYILQTRAITSLFPVPEVSFDPLIAWFSFAAVQGLVGAVTPLGQDGIRHVAANATSMFGMRPDPENFRLFSMAGERIWVKISDVYRNPIGFRAAGSLLNFVEPSVGQIMASLAADPRMGGGQGRIKFSTLRRMVAFFLPIMAKMAYNMHNPQKARDEFDQIIEARLSAERIAPAADRFSRLAAVAAFLRERTGTVFAFLLPKFIPVFGPSMGALNLLKHLSGDANLALEVTRSLPRNVTTEMDLMLWETAQTIKGDPGSEKVFRETDAEDLARLYLEAGLPGPAQNALTGFMQKFGMRGVGEIDFGQPRWRENPAPVIHSLQSYLKTPAESAPPRLFARGEQEALAAIEKIAAKVRQQPGGWLKEKMVRAAAVRIRLLMSARESPKFFAIRTMGVARQALLEVGREFVQAGTLRQPDDLVFLKLAELEELAREGIAPNGNGRDWKALVAARRTTYEREVRRRQVPRVLASDGRAFYEGLGAETDNKNTISGSPVSPGVVEGIVHVVLDPRGTQLKPGEILVCPGTDPAWTPLFMVAGGLITEVGGVMTHGSVVAREYGIPAVVGVHQATTRLKDGQRIRLDGSSGKILLLDPEPGV